MAWAPGLAGVPVSALEACLYFSACCSPQWLAGMLMKIQGDRRQFHGFCSPGPGGHSLPVPLSGSPRYP
eukprot:2331446-Heterocapsa_arctica.AAC.1